MGGRPAGEQPQTLIRIAATPDEISIIQSLTPRERAEAMIKAAQEKANHEDSNVSQPTNPRHKDEL